MRHFRNLYVCLNYCACKAQKKEFYAVVKDDVDSNKNSWVSMSRVCLRYMKDIIAL